VGGAGNLVAVLDARGPDPASPRPDPRWGSGGGVGLVGGGLRSVAAFGMGDGVLLRLSPPVVGAASWRRGSAQAQHRGGAAATGLWREVRHCGGAPSPATVSTTGITGGCRSGDCCGRS
jgi:hypothetical protein